MPLFSANDKFQHVLLDHRKFGVKHDCIRSNVDPNFHTSIGVYHMPIGENLKKLKYFVFYCFY
jgi:hypothetical protein